MTEQIVYVLLLLRIRKLLRVHYSYYNSGRTNRNNPYAPIQLGYKLIHKTFSNNNYMRPQSITKLHGKNCTTKIETPSIPIKQITISQNFQNE